MTMQACTSTWDQDVLYYTVWKQFRLNLEISLTVKIVQDGDDDDSGDAKYVRRMMMMTMEGCTSTQ